MLGKPIISKCQSLFVYFILFLFLQRAADEYPPCGIRRVCWTSDSALRGPNHRRSPPRRGPRTLMELRPGKWPSLGTLRRFRFLENEIYTFLRRSFGKWCFKIFFCFKFSALDDDDILEISNDFKPYPPKTRPWTWDRSGPSQKCWPKPLWRTAYVRCSAASSVVAVVVASPPAATVRVWSCSWLICIVVASCRMGLEPTRSSRPSHTIWNWDVLLQIEGFQMSDWALR